MRTTLVQTHHLDSGEDGPRHPNLVQEKQEAKKKQMDRSFHICIPVRLNQQRDLQIQHEPINSSVIQHTLARAN